MTERNRLKRLARESFRRQLPGLPAHDYLVYFFSTAVTADSGVLRTALMESFARFRPPKTG